MAFTEPSLFTYLTTTKISHSSRHIRCRRSTASAGATVKIMAQWFRRSNQSEELVMIKRKANARPHARRRIPRDSMRDFAIRGALRGVGKAKTGNVSATLHAGYKLE